MYSGNPVTLSSYFLSTRTKTLAKPREERHTHSFAGPLTNIPLPETRARKKNGLPDAVPAVKIPAVAS